MKIFLEKKSWERKSEIQELVNNELFYNPNFNGCEATIEKSDFECNFIEDCEEISGNILLSKINNLLDI